ncbi:MULTISPECIES: hypothetical protein [Maribacter]|uniref:Lipoprotein n=1 Tax=Maribacter flavus TaxID=1658664 RepID=A0ABU7IE84_9FLAO|nr:MULTISPECIES: hypothetical protein [Maribacter]MDC6404109.1 hypothetical protein [Maribacter sp. PR66]MEE1971250.1 hypothetical protein [Maribacter flavus]
MIKKYTLVVAFFALVLGSCSMEDDEPNFNFKALRIESAELPEYFNLNETYQIKVTYLLPDGCTQYEGFDVTMEDTTVRNVVAIGVAMTDLVSCTQAVIQEEASFNFIVKYDQPYTFRFYQGENSDGEPEFLEVEVPVN